jgi:hypothetical protein
MDVISIVGNGVDENCGRKVDLVEGPAVGSTYCCIGCKALGSVVGRLVATNVGIIDCSLVVGEALGCAEGVLVGEGVAVGGTVGLLVFVGPLVLGALVGSAEIEGAALGLLLGWDEFKRAYGEGTVVGSRDGRYDGDEVAVRPVLLNVVTELVKSAA